MKVAERIKQLGGIDYELAVREEPKGYFGSWFCRTCWVGGVNYDVWSAADGAMAQAELGALQHHESTHNS